MLRAPRTTPHTPNHPPAKQQILDDGRCTDSQGRPVSFKHALIIMTSNLGASDIYKSLQSGGSGTGSGGASAADRDAVRELVMAKARALGGRQRWRALSVWPPLLLRMLRRARALVPPPRPHTRAHPNDDGARPNPPTTQQANPRRSASTSSPSS